MSLKRTYTGLAVAAGWVALLYYLPAPILFVILLGAMVICMIELRRIMSKAGYCLPMWTVCFAGTLWMLYGYGQIRGVEMPLGAHTGDALSAFLFFVLFMRIMLDKTIKRPLETLALTALSYLYIPYFLSFFMRLTSYPFGAAESNHSASIMLILFIVSIVKMSDAGGYFIGSACGKHKLIPRLSPGKSWEGLFGGLLFSLITAGIFYWVARTGDFPALAAIKTFTLCHIMALTVILVIVGLLGDLLESLLKRAANVKDSSALFPAMGGFLDTFDSLIFTPAVLYYYMIWMQY